MSIDAYHKYPELRADHPLVTTDVVRCAGCDGRFVAGDHVTLLAVGPGSDAEARQLAREGKPYNAVAIPVHWACATGEE